MKRVLLNQIPEEIPERLEKLLSSAKVYDSSSSPEAKVYFIDKDGGYFLKKAAKDSLLQEAQMTEYFHKKKLATAVLDYFTDGYDWLLTEKVPGEDCIHRMYLDDPVRLCDTLAELLRKLHEEDYSGCPVMNHTERYLQTVEQVYHEKRAQRSPEHKGFASVEEAYREVQRNKMYLKTDTLLHGDYCLPNIILNQWKFSGFIDVDHGGVGDRHVDLYWGLWSLNFNLKTDRYRQRFLDAYGRDKVNEDALRVIAAAEVFG